MFMCYLRITQVAIGLSESFFFSQELFVFFFFVVCTLYFYKHTTLDGPCMNDIIARW